MRGVAVELPPEAAARLGELRLQSDAALDAARSANARLQMLPPDADERMRTALAGEQSKHNARHAQLSRLLSATNQWLLELRPNVALEPVPAISVALQDGETLNEAISNVRNEITSTKQHLQSVRSASLPKEDMKGLCEAFVVQLLRRGKPTVTVQHDQLKVALRGDMVVAEDVLALIAWANPDGLYRALEREIDGLPTRADAMPANERIKRVAELEVRLLELERREESLIMQAGGEGLELLRRVDADPAVVLGVVVAKVKTEAAA